MTTPVASHPDHKIDQPFSKSPQKIVGLYGLAKSYLKEEKYSKAMKAALKALELDPQDRSEKGKLYSILVRANLDVGNLSQAGKLLQAAIQYSPQNVKIEEMQKQLFNRYMDQNKKDKAIKYVDEVCSIEAISPKLKSTLREKQCFYYLANFQLEEAERSIKAGFEQDPSSEALRTLHEWLEFVKTNCSSVHLCSFESSTIGGTFKIEDVKKEIVFLENLLKKYQEPSNVSCWLYCRLIFGTYITQNEEFSRDRERHRIFKDEHLRTINSMLSWKGIFPEVRGEVAWLGLFLGAQEKDRFLDILKESFTTPRYLYCKGKVTQSPEERFNIIYEALAHQPSLYLTNLIFISFLGSMLINPSSKTDLDYERLSETFHELDLSMKLYPIKQPEGFLNRYPIFRNFCGSQESIQEIKASTLCMAVLAILAQAKSSDLAEFINEVKETVSQHLEQEESENDREYIRGFIERVSSMNLPNENRDSD